jgi:uncharacterized protein YjbJ (UPF0337 family)
MSGKSDQVTGGAMQAAGIVTGNRELEAEGSADRQAGEAEEEIENAKRRVEELIDKTTANIERAADKAKEALH